MAMVAVVGPVHPLQHQHGGNIRWSDCSTFQNPALDSLIGKRASAHLTSCREFSLWHSQPPGWQQLLYWVPTMRQAFPTISVHPESPATGGVPAERVRILLLESLGAFPGAKNRDMSNVLHYPQLCASSQELSVARSVSGVTHLIQWIRHKTTLCPAAEGLWSELVPFSVQQLDKCLCLTFSVVSPCESSVPCFNSFVPRQPHGCLRTWVTASFCWPSLAYRLCSGAGARVFKCPMLPFLLLSGLFPQV